MWLFSMYIENRKLKIWRHETHTTHSVSCLGCEKFKYVENRMWKMWRHETDPHNALLLGADGGVKCLQRQ